MFLDSFKTELYPRPPICWLSRVLVEISAYCSLLLGSNGDRSPT